MVQMKQIILAKNSVSDWNSFIRNPKQW